MDRTGETAELLGALIRNACVNDGTDASGGEIRSARTIADYLDGARVDLEIFEPFPGRGSLVARLQGRDPGAPTLCLLGHTDVVPVDPTGWSRDPFGAEIAGGELWGRGAVDMLNVTASMAIVFLDLVRSGRRPRGDVVFAAVADEESGGKWGAQWLADNRWDLIGCDYLVTEGGGIHTGPQGSRAVTFNVAEKGVSWRRLTISGEPGHGSMPFRRDNALVRAAAVIERIAAYSPRPTIHELWTHQVAALDLDPETKARLVDRDRLDEALAGLPDAGAARHLHACSHTTFSPNAVDGSFKTNTIPSTVIVDVDVRTLPGETPGDVAGHLRDALGPLAAHVEVGELLDSVPSTSSTATPLWESIGRAVQRSFPSARATPQLHMGFTDARIFRARGTVAYGAGLFSENLTGGDFASRFHGHDERVDLPSLDLTTRFFSDLVEDFSS